MATLNLTLPCSVNQTVYAIRDRDKDDYYGDCLPYVVSEEIATHVGITENEKFFVITEDCCVPEIIGVDIFLTFQEAERYLLSNINIL